MTASGRDTWLSAVMPTYNGARYLEQALESVRRETTDGIEVVVVDDGSSDATLDIVRRYEALLPLRVLAGRRVANWAATTNLGLRAARGRFACVLHQDDLWLPGRLAAIHDEVRNHPGTRLLLHPAVFVGPGGERLGRWSCPLQAGVIDPECLLERLLVQNFIAMPSPVFDRAAALESGGLDESLWYTADWDLWLRLGGAGDIRFIEAPLAAFRVHAESQTAARRTTHDELFRQMTTVLERHLSTWPAQGRRRGCVERVARFSIEANAALAAAVRGQARLPALALARRFLALGPSGWRRYFRDSRIGERVASRLRLRTSDQPP